MNNLVIAVDGPAGAGKSTISKVIAQKLDINYIDTGAMYRAFTLKILRNNIDLSNIDLIIKILKNTDITFENNHIILDGEIVDDMIRTREINKNVSNIAKIKQVRERLVELQRQISLNTDLIMDGRDIGSHVLPKANFKFYITASTQERGRRRYEEFKIKDNTVVLQNIIKDIENRDRIDSTREIAPLIKCDDAIEIDTTNKTIEQAVNEILKYISKGGC